MKDNTVTGILRDGRKSKGPRVVDPAIIGLVIVGISVLAGLLTAIGWPRFFSDGIYGLFGVYAFAIFLAGIAGGLCMKFSKKYTFNKRYVITATVMATSMLMLLHVVFTDRYLNDMNFGEYLGHGFGAITPGGVVFAIPSFVVWNVFAGTVGASIVLCTTFIIASAFLATFIITKNNENRVIKHKPKDLIDKESKEVNKSKHKRDLDQLNKHVEQRYQELLKTESRKKIDSEKSLLGLDKVQPEKTVSTAIHDAPVPLGSIKPQFVGDEITGMSTQAALAFTSGLQQPLYMDQQPPQQFQQQNYIQPQPPMQQGYPPMPQYIQPQYMQPQPMMPSQPMPPPLQPQPQQHIWAAAPPPPADVPTSKPDVESILTEYAIKEKPEPIVVTSRTPRAPRTQSPIAGQTSIDDSVMETAKPKKVYKPVRYNRPGMDLIRTESTDLSSFFTDAEVKKGILNAKLKEFGVKAEVVDYLVAPAITRFEVILGQGTRVNDLHRHENDFAMTLGTDKIRIDNIAGKAAIGIEVPNKKVGKVAIRDLIQSKEWQTHKSPLAVALGRNVNDELILGDIATMPHLLIAGSTGSGKSVCINTILTSLIYRADPADVKLLLIDMKLVELGMYNEIPHMLIPRSIGEVQQAKNALKWVQEEMTRRYKTLQACGLKHITQYHSLTDYKNGQLERMPYIILVIDEAADLIHNGKREVEDAVQRLAALGRASGIHLILATQRPSVDVITAVIKTNLPVRLGFKTVSRGDSVTIVNEPGCEKLVGYGDMLYMQLGTIQRVQCAYIDDEEARNVMNYIRANNEVHFDHGLEDLILNGPPQAGAAMGFGDGAAASRGQ
ncbi:MAG: DNA translocase FtsK, partial [Firmicutes bacterium]|nr:DNA translocase FtsK [Bacillota bacterium]